MNNIIQQIGAEWLENILEKLSSNKIQDIDALAAELNTDCKAVAVKMAQAHIEEMNKKIREDKAARKKMRLVIKEKDRERSIYTKLGLLRIKRDYYYDGGLGAYVAVLDEVLGISKYERIGKAIRSQMVNLAADMSYAKSASLSSPDPISRQSVRNHILKMQLPEVKAEEKKKVQELHIYADEDHVHMQKPGKQRGKKSQIVPLVTVTEGTEQEGKSRNRTISPTHFADEEFNTKRLWKTVEGYIEKNYEVESIEKIYIHGDGGAWIKPALESFTQTVHVMDGYHFGKALKQLSKAFPTRQVRKSIENSVMDNDRQEAEKFLKDLIENAKGKERKKATEFAAYISNNWEEIRALRTLNTPGSCTEAQISHVLSERFSRDPMGWSREGLGKLSCVRVSKINGVPITPEMLKERKEEEKYAEYADRIIDEISKSKLNWDIVDKPPYVFDGASGTQAILKHLGINRGILMS